MADFCLVDNLFDKEMEMEDSFEYMELTEEDCMKIDQLVASSSATEQEKMEKYLKQQQNENIPAPTGSRFKKLDERDLKDLEENRQSLATKRNTKWGVNMFQDWCLENEGRPTDFASTTPTDLCDKLRRFYAEATPRERKKRTESLGPALASEYHKNSMKNVRSAINRHIQDLKLDMDIVRDKDFRAANEMLDAKLKSNISKGLSRATKHKQIIDTSDLKSISTYLNAKSDPVILRYKVWYTIAIQFVTRGLEFHKQLSTNSFEFHTENGREYAVLNHEMKQKNHQDGLKSEETYCDKRMYATNDENCPVAALKFLISKTDPNAISLFNHCNKQAMLTPESESFWFSSTPVKHHQFTRFMGDISRNAKCSKLYTAHCLRATAIQALSDADFELRQIMFMSGHKNECSVRSYSRDCSTKQKQTLSETLSMVVSPVSVASTSSDPDVRPTCSFVDQLPAAVVAVKSNPGNSEPTGNVSVANAMVRFAHQNQQSNNYLSAGIMSNSCFTNCSIQFYGMGGGNPS